LCRDLAWSLLRSLSFGVGIWFLRNSKVGGSCLRASPYGAGVSREHSAFGSVPPGSSHRSAAFGIVAYVVTCLVRREARTGISPKNRKR
jgi:hypothetical protein